VATGPTDADAISPQPTDRAAQGPTAARPDDTDRQAVYRAWRQYQDMASSTGSPFGARAERRSAATAADHLQPPAAHIGDYQLLREIHRGGQGIVYQATQQSTGRRVAIKVMRAGLFASTAEMARFEREIHLLVQLRHPNIVTVYDSGVDAGHCYYVMDYIEGESLDGYIARHDLSIDDTLRLFCRICDAVNVAHLRGVIHRDLKPSNIRIDRAGEPHILDFGLAKVSEYDVLAHGGSEVMTQTGQFVGSAPWASPEQAQDRSEHIDIRTDVYAIGVLLYRALTGRFPYVVFGPLLDVLHNILTVDPTRPGAIQPQINDEVDTIVLKCLGKNREHRYQSAGELARDIRRYLAGDPIEAKRDSGWYLFKKAIRRYRVRTAIAGLAMLLVIHSVVTLAVLNYRESRLRVEAQRQAAIANAVNDFLNRDLLAAVKPGNQGLDVTVRQVLDAASERVEDRFANQPMVEAAIRDTLGNTYMELGEWKHAVLHAERALQLRRAELGSEHVDTLSTTILVARLYRRLGRLAEAESLYNQMIEPARKSLGNEHEITTKAISNYAVLLTEMGRDQEAILHNADVLAIRRRTLGPEHPDTLTSMNNQAYMYARLGRLNEAEQLYMQVLDTRRRVLGPQHPLTLLSMSNLADKWSQSGRLRDAEHMHVERLALVRKVQGRHHPNTVSSLSALGDLCRRQHRFDDAERYLVEALNTQRALCGDDHPRTASRMGDLGKLYFDQGRFEEAEQSLSRSIAVFKATVGEKHPALSDALLALGRCYRAQGRFAESKTLLLQAHRLIARRLGPDHEHTRDAVREVIALLEAWGRAGEAATWRGKLEHSRLSPFHQRFRKPDKGLANRS